MGGTVTARPRGRLWMLPLLVSVAWLLVAPLGVSAQVVATSFEELRALVKSGETIYVTDASGRQTKGRLGELSASSLELLVGQTGPNGRETFVPKARLSERDVRQILLQRRDSLWNGTLIGMAVWLGIGALPATIFGCSNYEGLHPSVGSCAGAWGLFAGIGAGMGAAIDALITERTTVYYQAPGQRSSGVQLFPLFSQSANGIQMSVRF